MPHYALPALSGVLLALALYPFYLWPLALVALVPLYYFCSAAGRSGREAFFAGAITGALGIGPTIYFSLAMLRLLPDALAFSYMIRASSVPLLLLVAVLFGVATYGYVRLRGRNVFMNALVAGVLYGIAELCLFGVFGGYYLGAFSHAVVGLPLVGAYAALGGALFVSLLVVWASCAVAEVWQLPHVERRRWLWRVGATLAAVVCIGWAYQVYLLQVGEPLKTFTVSTLQMPYAHSADVPFGTEEGGVFTNPTLGERIGQAAQDTDLLIYPFSPVQGVVYHDAPADVPVQGAQVSVGALHTWLRSRVPAETSVLVWNSGLYSGEIYDEYMLSGPQEPVFYQKRALYPLSDYLPWWGRIFGLQARHFTTQKGSLDSTLAIGELNLGGLICSELHQAGLVRHEARRSPLLVAVGSDTMFPGDIAGNFSLAAARYRAAENNVVVVRGNLVGPSAIVRPSGSLQAVLRFGEEGVLSAEVQLTETRRTLYGVAGSWTIYLAMLGVLAYAAACRINPAFRSPGRLG